MGTILGPKLTSQDPQQAQTPRDFMSCLFHVSPHGLGHHAQADYPL